MMRRRIVWRVVCMPKRAASLAPCAGYMEYLFLNKL
jgi:hypothetical protein